MNIFSRIMYRLQVLVIYCPVKVKTLLQTFLWGHYSVLWDIICLSLVQLHNHIIICHLIKPC